MKRVLFMLLTTLSLVPTLAEANPSRARLLFHGHRDLTLRIGLTAHFIPAPNLVEGIAPLAFLELNIRAASWLDIAPTVGWALKSDEAIASLRLTARYQKWWGWVDFELRPQSWGGYWFVQAQYRVLDWLHVGVEMESWGNFTNFSAFSHGGGPNLLLRPTKNSGLDIAVHVRETTGEIGSDFLLRAHVFL